MDSVARGTLINLATRLTAVGGVLCITAVTARLGTSQQGAFALFTSIEGVMLGLFSGFGVALARQVSHKGDSPPALLSAMVLACTGLGVVAGGLLWALSVLGPRAYAPLWLLALGSPFLLLAPNLAGLWLGAGRMGPMSRITLAPPFITLALLGVLWLVQRTGLLAVLSSWIAAKVLVGIAVLAVLWRVRRLAAPSWAALCTEVPFIATIGLTNLIGLLNYRVGLFVVERMLDLSAAGVYSIAVMVAELLWFVSSSLTQAAYGRIGSPDRVQAAATTLRAVHLSLAALLLAAPLLWVTARVLIPWVLGPAYVASLPLLAILLPGVLVFGGGSALSAYFTNHVGRPEVPAKVATLSLLLNGALAAALVPSLGMAGAALAASCSYTLAVGVMAWRFARHAGLPLRSLAPGRQLVNDLRAVALRTGGP
jgi:O-antigen/teichoic acid export membrane protein